MGIARPETRKPKRRECGCFRLHLKNQNVRTWIRAHRVNATGSIVLVVSLLCAVNAFGQSVDQSVDKEPAAVVELGGAPGWNLKDGGWTFGPTLAVEVTPIENWLELEMGVTATFRHHSTEWSTDLLFKKPWTLSK